LFDQFTVRVLNDVYPVILLIIIFSRLQLVVVAPKALPLLFSSFPLLLSEDVQPRAFFTFQSQRSISKFTAF
jgi:hypothetical protein